MIPARLNIFNNPAFLQAAIDRGFAPQPEGNDPKEEIFLGAMKSVAEAQREFGLIRLRMGALLCVAHDSGKWAGRAHGGFNNFLRESGIEPHAASQYMAAARAFIFDMNISSEALAKISMTSMRVLVAASHMVNSQNLDEVLHLLTDLHREDAIEEIDALATAGRRAQ